MRKLKWTRCLMITSYGLLIVFAVQWLQSQYRNEQDQLTKDIARLFTSVQQQITDSLLLANVVTPVTDAHAAASLGSNAANDPIASQSMRLMLQKANKLSSAQKESLFRIDTAVFNELFAGSMQQQGWDFSAQWVRSQDSGKETGKRIYIPSNFFTTDYGLVIQRHQGYLYRRMLPQFGFVLVLLGITGFAFWSAYKSLRDQILLSRMKDDFVSNMSHELKTPISTVKLALEALTNFNGMDDPARRGDYLAMADAEMNRLELLVNKALNTSLLESGKLFIKPELCDLKELTEQALSSVHHKLKAQGATVNFQAAGDHFISNVDKLHTQGVLMNLIDNSMKYGQAPVTIDIRLKEAEDTIQLSVQDNGPGIPEEYTDRVFEKFFRVPTGNRHNIKGYGLGLSYAAQVMQQHKGDIRVRNVPAGGCMFTLTF